MTHAKRLATDQRLTATGWAAVLARGIRADVPPGDWPTEIARLAERLSEMADARRGDAAVIRQRQLAVTARRDAAMLEAVAGELELQAIRLQSGDAE
jgi:hypothetical protein